MTDEGEKTSQSPLEIIFGNMYLVRFLEAHFEAAPTEFILVIFEEIRGDDNIFPKGFVHFAVGVGAFFAVHFSPSFRLVVDI